MRKLGLIIVALAMGTITFSGISSANVRAEEKPKPTVLLFGDSLAAGYGLAPEEALAAQLSSSLADQGHPVTLINAGVSGDTTAGGLARLDWALTPETEIVIIILGGNDALRAIAPSQTEQNLDALLTDLATRGLKVLLTGMRAPPNLGPEFASEFEPIYARLATKHDVALFPFVLEGVAADPTLNQDDGIHPNKDGVSTIVRNILPYLLPLLNGANQTE